MKTPILNILILLNWAALVAMAIGTMNTIPAIAGTTWALITLVVLNQPHTDRCKNCD